MAISTNNFKSNLTESIYNQIKTLVGTTYTNNIGTVNITYISGYPTDITVYKNDLPLIILDRGIRQRQGAYEQGGRRRYDENYNIYVIAGGYKNESVNEFMKNSLTDKILFGFDSRVFNFTNYDTMAVEGTYFTNSNEVFRLPPTMFSVYEAHKSQILLNVQTAVKSGY